MLNSNTPQNSKQKQDKIQQDNSMPGHINIKITNHNNAEQPNMRTRPRMSSMERSQNINSSIARSQSKKVSIRSRTVFSTNRFQSIKAIEIFASFFKKIQANPKEFYRKQKTVKKNTLLNKPKDEVPTCIVDTLYRQNIKNYNAYTATLQILEDNNDISAIQKERISKLCHIGAAKQFVKAKKYSEGPTYSRVNVQIRPYMRQKMNEQMKFHQQKYQNVVFIPSDELALSFNPHTYPQELTQSISQQQFSTTISQVNAIIQKQYVNYKASGIHMFTQSLSARIVLSLIVLLALIFAIKPVKQVIIILFGLVLAWVLLSIYECKSKLEQLVRSKNVTNTILEKINTFFLKINNEQTQWRVGQDFYWLEIHFIKRKKGFRFK